MRDLTAKEILESQTFKKILNRQREEIKTRFTRTELGDTETLKSLQCLYRAVEDFERLMRSEAQAEEHRI